MHGNSNIKFNNSPNVLRSIQCYCNKHVYAMSLFPYPTSLKMEVVRSSEMFVTNYQTARRYITRSKF